nr:hypothetical protein GCM10017745_40410 [Saccharothrix mutabilis subsp. capreolus]
MASAACRTCVSVMPQPKLFQLFHPNGGVSAGLREQQLQAQQLQARQLQAQQHRTQQRRTQPGQAQPKRPDGEQSPP